MNAEEFTDLKKRAEGGDVKSMTAFGKVLIAGADGRAVHLPSGARYIARAAEKGDAEALAQQAILVAAGIQNPPDWDRALEMLQRAAQTGWLPAQEQLRFLADGSGENFDHLRKRIDVASWLRPPETKVVCEWPRMLIARRLMRDGECARVIEKARGKLRRAGIYDLETGAETVVDERSNSKAELSLLDIDVPFVMLIARMSSMLGLPSQFFEPTNVLHYAPGQEFKPHHDFLSTNEPGLAANVKALGQRIVTLLVYLNDRYEGGETRFPQLNYAFKGAAGDALMFGNVNAKGEPDERTLHAGTPPLSGEKWVLSQWVRNRPAVLEQQQQAS